MTRHRAKAARRAKILESETGQTRAPRPSTSLATFRESVMTDIELQDFVTRYAAAWAARDGNAFLALWHPDGVLRTPFVGRAVAGSELKLLNDTQKALAPDLIWQLLDWTSRDDVVILEWQNSRVVDGKRYDFPRRRQVPAARRQDRRGDRLCRYGAGARCVPWRGAGAVDQDLTRRSIQPRLRVAAASACARCRRRSGSGCGWRRSGDGRAR